MQYFDDEEAVSECLIVKRNLNVLLAQEEDHWRQRAKLFWLKEGDANTRFFHTSANARRKNNKISKLQDDSGVWCDDVDGLQNIVKKIILQICTQKAEGLTIQS